ncbi:MAG: CRISPR-associated endonuclease Cas1 [Chloroflexi bacterium]|nr:MAG: CRISPR-associated endonuclease Cas1 [Phototrophicales bacterium]RMF81432.1 MAG: CRISPR-associated endonuclease Cas1 [Chloroflexota bacterium]
MSVVYVREQRAVIRKNGEQLRVTAGNEELFTIPMVNLEQLVVMGNAQLTTPAAVLLMRTGIDVVFLSMYGKYRGRLTAMESHFAELRQMQLRLCDDEMDSLALATQIVTGKIINQRVVLQRRAQEDPHAAQTLDGMMHMLHSLEHATTLDQLRGYEGKAAAFYFDGIRTFFDPEWQFAGRDYYPPPDPANAMLSFAYTMVLKDVEAKIQLVGLDPYLGFFHTLGYNRPGLALDLMEEFRPSIADIVVLNLVTSGTVTLDHFEWTNDPERPVRMSKDAVDLLVQAYEGRLADHIYHPLANGQTDYRRAIELQVRQMARIVRGEALDYEPLLMQ